MRGPVMCRGGPSRLVNHGVTRGRKAKKQIGLFAQAEAVKKEPPMKREYKPGTFCVDIQCERHEVLASLKDDEYLMRKRQHCRDCLAWQFFAWLEKKKWRVVRGLPQMSTKEIAARLKGIDPVKAEHLTEEEILCL
jgi:hypothetical protein